MLVREKLIVDSFSCLGNDSRVWHGQLVSGVLDSYFVASGAFHV
ncbi:unnamed protein product [Rhodiola kirilowii]